MSSSPLQPVKEKIGSSLWSASFVCSLATVFLLYEFILQVSPSVITKELMHDLNLNTAASLGAVLAFYHYAYTIMQLPAGVLLDRFGPQKLLTVATLTCAIGALLFGTAVQIPLAATGRFLMGIGSAFAFSGALFLVSTWFPPRYFSILAGIVQLSSCIGAIAGQVLVTTLTKQLGGWRRTLNGLGITGIVLALLIWLVVRDRPYSLEYTARKSHVSLKQEIQRISIVFSNRQTWWIGLYSFTVWAPTMAFVALWGIPFLIQAYSLNSRTASNACAVIWLGIGIGSPLLGLFSNYIQRRRLPLTLSALIGVFSLSFLIYRELSPFWFYINLFLTGLSATGQALSFSVVKDNNPAEVTGTAVGLNNMAVVSSAALFQPLLGLLLTFSQNKQVNVIGEVVYSKYDYQYAFFALPLCYLLAAVISHFCIQETYCQSND